MSHRPHQKPQTKYLHYTPCPSSAPYHPHLDTWNHTRLSQHKTTMFKGCLTYPEKQNIPINTIIRINTNINQSINQNTPSHPNLQTPSLQNLRKNKKHRVNYWRLVDGGIPHRVCEGGLCHNMYSGHSQKTSKQRSGAITRPISLTIARADPSCMLNKREEILSTCRHRTIFRYTEVQSAQP